jgi:hypothetical protein
MVKTQVIYRFEAFFKMNSAKIMTNVIYLQKRNFEKNPDLDPVEFSELTNDDKLSKYGKNASYIPF